MNSLTRFLITGVLSNVIALVIGNGLFWLLGSAALGSAIGYAVGLANSFLLGKFWVFRSEGTDPSTAAGEFWRFALVYAISGITLTGLCYLLVDILGFNYALSYIGAGVIAATMNYLGSRFFVFSASTAPEARDT